MLRKAQDTGISLHRGSVGEPERDSLAETFDRNGEYIWVPLLDPEDIKILIRLGAIWNFGKGTRLS